MTHLLIVVVLILAVIVLAKVVRILELNSEIREEDQSVITEKDNRTQSWLMLIGGFGYLAFVTYAFIVWGKLLLPPSASEHGADIDFLMKATLGIITPMFFLTHILLAVFAFKYYHRKNRTSAFFSHSTKLEMIWTVIPTIVLTSLIVYGLKVWSNINSPASDEAIVIELYGKQFDWTARYSGHDNKLGKSGYRLINGANALGVSLEDPASADDKIVHGEMHLPVGMPVVFKFHSRDVIHSAYMPHFRLQMNCVPGMTTQFHMVPKTTTADMRKETGNPDFDYLLLCNKICGSAHYNMQMKIVVESQSEYELWLAGKKNIALTLMKKDTPETVETIESTGSVEDGQATEVPDLSENSRTQKQS